MIHMGLKTIEVPVTRYLCNVCKTAELAVATDPSCFRGWLQLRPLDLWPLQLAELGNDCNILVCPACAPTAQARLLGG